MNSIEIIKGLCKKRGIAISKLEKDCGFGNGYISKIQSRGITSDRLNIIAKYLNVSTDYLLTGKESEPKDVLNSEQLEAYKKMISLSPESLQKAVSYLDYLIYQDKQ